MRCEESLRTRLASFAWRVGMLGCAAALLAGSATAAGQEADYEKLLGDKSPAIVTVKFLLKMKSNWGDHESEQEAPGVMLGSDGLVMCANSHFGGGSWMRSAGVTATPSALKVLIGTDTEGVEATIVARDTELDLAWLRIKEAGDKKFAGIDLQKSAAPVRQRSVGHRLRRRGRRPDRGGRRDAHGGFDDQAAAVVHSERGQRGGGFAGIQRAGRIGGGFDRPSAGRGR